MWLSYLFIDDVRMTSIINSKETLTNMSALEQNYNHSMNKHRKCLQCLIASNDTTTMESVATSVVSGKAVIKLESTCNILDLFAVPDAFASPSKIAYATNLATVLQSICYLEINYHIDNNVSMLVNNKITYRLE